jgi:multiple sugar transport system substrate-binding protein
MGNVRTLLAAFAVVLALGGCGGGGADEPEGGQADRRLTVWILEDQPDRVRATRANVARFGRAGGFEVDVVPIGDDELAGRVAVAASRGLLPDVLQLPMASAHAYAREGMLSSDAAQDVVDRLGEETFSARALSLMTSEGTVTAVPSDAWGQLLIYRKDLFAGAGLPAPRTLEDVRRAARRLKRPLRAGVAMATAPTPFTAETFEHVALAAGCELLDDGGAVALTSPECVRAFEIYVELARTAPRAAGQDVESTRDDYFAGDAAMVFWSPFLLDAMAGMRDDAIPSCPQCREDPAFLARSSGLVGPLESPDGSPAQFGTISGWGITADANIEGAEQFVEYMMSDGYLRWLSLAPQGKFPVRTGDPAEPDRYVRAWGRLPSGVDRKAPLTRYYSPASIASFGEGARNLRRWGFEQDGAALVGALRGPEPVAKAVAAAVAGKLTPAQAARRAQAEVERLRRELG